MTQQNLTGQTVLITGASRGIGEAAACAFAEHGANVVLCARSTDAITDIAAQIGDKALALTCDVSSADAMADVVAQAIDKFSSLDVLIGNAG